MENQKIENWQTPQGLAATPEWLPNITDPALRLKAAIAYRNYKDQTRSEQARWERRYEAYLAAGESNRVAKTAAGRPHMDLQCIREYCSKNTIELVEQTRQKHAENLAFKKVTHDTSENFRLFVNEKLKTFKLVSEVPAKLRDDFLRLNTFGGYKLVFRELTPEKAAEELAPYLCNNDEDINTEAETYQFIEARGYKDDQQSCLLPEDWTTYTIETIATQLLGNGFMFWNKEEFFEENFKKLLKFVDKEPTADHTFEFWDVDPEKTWELALKDLPESSNIPKQYCSNCDYEGYSLTDGLCNHCFFDASNDEEYGEDEDEMHA